MDTTNNEKVQDVSVAEARQLQKNGVVLIDVREDDEWAAGHAPDATHIALAEVTSHLDELRQGEFMTVCRSGGRSSKAAAIMREAGVNVRNVSGGMNAWNSEGLPVVNADGNDGTVV